MPNKNKNSRSSKNDYKSKPHGRNSNRRGGNNSKSFDFKKGDASYTSNKMNCVDSQVGKTNDVNWYVTDDQMLKDVASLPSGRPLGTEIRIIPEDQVYHLGTAFTPRATPGVMVFDYLPSIGYSWNRTSSVNLAAQSLTTFVKHINSGDKSYETPELMMYLLAMSQLYTVFEEGRRAYGVAHAYSRTNRYYAEAICQAVRFPNISTTESGELQKFRAALNQIAARIAQFPVPGFLNWDKRHRWLSSNTWVDSMSDKAQTYVFRMSGVFKWASVKYETGTSLEYVPWETQFGTTVDSFIEGFNDMIDSLMYDSDIGILTRDIMHSFADKPFVQLELIDENYTVTPIFDAEIVSQCQNAVILGDLNGQLTTESMSDPTSTEIAIDELHGCDIYQKDGAICWNPVFKGTTRTIASSGKYYSLGKLLNFGSTNVSPADVMLATRFTYHIINTIVNDTTHDFICDSIGSEVLTKAQVISYARLTSSSDWKLFTTDITKYAHYDLVYDGEIGSEVLMLLQTLSGLDKFAYAPRFYTYINQGYAVPDLLCYTGEVDNLVEVPTTSLHLMHTMAMLRELAVDNLGSFSPLNRLV